MTKLNEFKDGTIVRLKDADVYGSVAYVPERHIRCVHEGRLVYEYKDLAALAKEWEPAIVCGVDEVPVNFAEIEPSLEEYEETHDLECARFIALHVLEAKEKYFPSKVVPEEPTEFGARVTVTRPDGTQELWIYINGVEGGGMAQFAFPWYSQHTLPCTWEEVLERGVVTLDTDD